ncbi:MAG: SUMF1/EgtB/PvdO family nonheme iron enzyme [Anaerolineae bacterium]|nr:SUMF1/EgtB/PvdO family nonheme iron enzyme [Anaerolineae bacterium]
MLAAPQTLGKYRILTELGRGGFATVYRAEDSTLGREVALKVLHPQLLTEAGWVERFHREARAIARLRHPHIVTIYEIGEAEGRLFITMELFKVGSVQDRLAQQGRYSWAEALRLLQQVADALDYAHGEGIIHRDLKPANILLDPHAGAVLTDFGFAKLVGESSMSLSLSGGVMGTPAYVAPEIWDGLDPTVQSDVYALGCVVYELFTGERLFEGKTPSVVMRKHLLDGPQFPASWPEGVPPGVEGVLRRALAREPGKRHASAGELLAALRHLEEAAVTRRQRDAEAAAATARERERLQAEAEKQRAAQKAAQKQAAADAAQRQQWEAERATAAARERYQAEQTVVAPPVYMPAQQPTPQGPPERKAVPTWAWVLLGLVGLVGALWGFSSLGSTPEKVVETVIVTQEVVRVITATPSPTPKVTATPKATATPRGYALGATRTREADGMVLVYAPAGEFQMGSTQYDAEQPVHTVALDGFWLDRTEVTNAQFAAFLTVTGNKTEGGATWLDSADEDCLIEQAGNTFRAKSGYAQHPVIEVTWYGAAAYCEWVGGRLPTEAEWEYAARGPEELSYPWGNEWDCTRGNFNSDCGSDSYSRTAPVGSFPEGASWVGALDLAGNVWEWVSDWYGSYPSGRQVNPTGPQSGASRVLRGGSWNNNEYITRGAIRLRYTPTNSNYSNGFRCGVSAAPGE